MPPSRKLIVADEPTTALDVTVQKQVLRLIREHAGATTAPRCCSSRMISASWRKICDRMTVLYGGKVLEQGATAEILAGPAHPYTRALLAASPRYDRPEQSLKPVPEALIAELKREIAS